MSIFLVIKIWHFDLYQCFFNFLLLVKWMMIKYFIILRSRSLFINYFEIDFHYSNFKPNFYATTNVRFYYFKLTLL